MILNPLIVIPSQLNEFGEPKKQLADVNGQSMVVHSYKRVKQAGIGSIIVDCVDDSVAEALGEAGAYTVKTNPEDLPKNHNYKTESGAERIQATVNRFDRFYTHDLIINVHEDMPTLEPKYIRALMYALVDREVGIATMVCPLDEGELNDPAFVKTSVDWNESRKVYVMKSSKVGTVVDFSRNPELLGDRPLYRHVPIYAYKRAALDRFVNSPPTDRELEENIESLRVLDAGIRMDVCLVDNAPFKVQSEDDLDQIREDLDTSL
jgi:3-deoxy-manno-octulosonate cytidylyltransferase (CMP-KDO synthetase)